MSEDRTQAPSKLRRLRARQHGQVAHSSALTGAAGLIVASLLLGIWGDDLALALIDVVREPLQGAPIVATDVSDVVGRLRHLGLMVMRPLCLIGSGFAFAAFAAHQAQVRGLWAPGLLAPDVSRLWSGAHGPGIATRGTRGVWSVIQATVIVAVTAWLIRSAWPSNQQLGGLETQALARSAGRSLCQMTLTLGAATLALGLADFALQHRRFEAMLRMTAEEQRQDQRSMEGDPALRSRRRRLAKSWRGDAAEILAGASLVLTGPGGLTVVLSGGPPPRRISVRSALQGVAGRQLRTAPDALKLPQVAAPALARRLSQRSMARLPLPTEVAAELAALWPPPPAR